MKSILFIGMDVHKETFSLCCYDGATGEIVAETKCDADVKMVAKFIDGIREDAGEDIEFKCGYEAGCLGFSVYNQLKARDIECDILAPTTMKMSVKNKAVKNDRMDARNIAQNLAHKTYKAVHVPDEDDLEVKEYIRMMNDFKKELKKVKQHILAFVLRYGYQFDGKSKWTISHIKWLRELKMSEINREILNEYLVQFDHLTEKIERFTARLDEFYHSEKYEEKVSKLRCFKGIDTTAAMTIQVETSDFDRFPNAKAYASYTGLTCGEQSSGEKIHHTCITKQGNSTLRTTYVECAQAIIKGSIYSPKSKKLKTRQKNQDAAVIAYADKCTQRLMKKYKNLTGRNVPHNKAIVAIARELACFVWGMETGNIY